MDESLVEKIQWLVDRAQISELLYSFARALDTKDAEGYVNNYADGGILELPDPTSTRSPSRETRRCQGRTCRPCMFARVPRIIGMPAAGTTATM